MMPLFNSETSLGVWIEMNCERCWRNDGCKIKEKAVTLGRKPREWERQSRPKDIAGTYKCSEFAKQPPVNKRKGQQFEDVPMFDDESLTDDVHFVPVEGWPEKVRKDKQGDHA